MKKKLGKEDELVELITEYLDTEGTKSQLLDILIKAIRYSDGVKDDNHEAVEPKRDQWGFVCGHCGAMLEKTYVYCSQCGRRIKRKDDQY